ncbi:MAG TPA: endonuclease MutS2 [Clostridiales bacterium]|nr:endonuclease MutS2 [Clostridiales bacterium]
MSNNVRSLELDKILSAVALCAGSEKGKQSVLSTQPSADLLTVTQLQKETEEAYYAMNRCNCYPSFEVDDITECIMRAKKMSMLTMGELLKIARLLRLTRNLKNSIGKLDGNIAPILTKMSNQLFLQNTLAEEIDRSIFSETEMNDCASERLGAIRREIKRNGERLRAKLNSYISVPEYQKALQDSVVTMRGDRYVIPVKREFKGVIAGLVHDRSASGQTLYVEPMAIVEMNNELKMLLADEKTEIERILHEFTARVSVISDELLADYEIITTMDVIFARAAYALSTRSTRPVLNQRGYIDIKRGRHPLIDKERVVPVSVSIGKDYNILLITGPNTGGKTVSLKLVGLFVLMTECGLFIPAEEESEVSVFDHVFCDVGDEQSIEQSLSTFSSHIKNIVEIMRDYNERSLILLDELGAGTDPDEGAALAVCITDRILKSGAKAIITTHYGKLKEYSYSTQGVENASMDFDPETYEPTFHLIIGIPGTSNALQIAERLGLDKEIIQEAKGKVGADRVYFDEVLMSADQARRQAEKEKETGKELNDALREEKRALQDEKNKLFLLREKLAATVRSEVKRRVAESLEEVNEILAELKKLLDEPQPKDYFEAAKLRKRIEEIANREEVDEDELEPELVGGVADVGDEVYIKKISKIATVVGLKRNGDYIVKIGNFTTTVKRGAAQKVKKV